LTHHLKPQTLNIKEKIYFTSQLFFSFKEKSGHWWDQAMRFEDSLELHMKFNGKIALGSFEILLKLRV
jgi:hypothetical protein